jgi:hypothetical protein
MAIVADQIKTVFPDAAAFTAMLEKRLKISAYVDAPTNPRIQATF